MSTKFLVNPRYMPEDISTNNSSHFQKEAIRFSLAGLLISLITFIIFKKLYPFPNLSPDSYKYITAAINKEPLTLWPIGYSKFLYWFQFITAHSVRLSLFQYTALISSILYLLLSIRILIKTKKWLLSILFICLACNPLILQLANFVGSDALFTAISIIWITQLFWLLIKPSTSLMISHAIVLLLLFTLRYNALWYPFLSLLTILTNTWSLKLKLISTLLVIGLPSLFIIRNGIYYQRLTGMSMYSAFGGWQMASNGLNAYSHAKPVQSSELPAEFRPLHSLVNEHIAYIKALPKRPDSLITTYYLWEPEAPLWKYMINNHLSTKKGRPLTFKEWAQLGPLFMSYGTYLIKNNPSEYCRYYLEPNLMYFIAPPKEYLGAFNMRKDTMDETVKTWFNYNTKKVYSVSKDGYINSIQLVVDLIAILNILFPLAALAFFVIEGINITGNKYSQILIIVTAAYIGNFIFSLLASGIVLRYQVFSFTLTLVFTPILLALLINSAFNLKKLLIHK